MERVGDVQAYEVDVDMTAPLTYARIGNTLFELRGGVIVPRAAITDACPLCGDKRTHAAACPMAS